MIIKQKIVDIKICLLIAFIGLFSCSKKDDYNVFVIHELSKPTLDTLDFEKEGTVNGVEVKITGNLNGKAILQFENGAERFHKIELEDNVNQVYETEWYSSKMFFKYLPDKNTQGDSLTLRFRAR
ncbi:hypothetical protein MM236_02150 [Belliella sp. DSM 107340]|uniref:Lipoprotein n=1 Tax=Belliella calami TaxID=2923436 RepID=A0ABS9UJH2_9BACT|nr:hypothetical protein [Belliella calami]MCH7396766.1 hypothetical protein [Belliella calami]